MPLKPPSRTQSTAVPVFALKWHSSPNIIPGHVLVYAGGGGSAKTGIGNAVHVQIDSRPECSITIDTGVEIGVALDVLVTQDKSIYVAIGVGDSVKIYRILQTEEDENDDNDGPDGEGKEGAIEVGSLDFEKGAGVNAVNFSATGAAIVAGCENGKLYVASLQFQSPSMIAMNVDFQLEGHIKAICSCSFHPRNPGVIISSAKDGTCRLWNLMMDGDDKCMKVLACKIYDPRGPKPKQPNILNPKPGQLLVRGCAFGDLEGNIIYTIQSGRKGGAFLSVWKMLRRVVPGEMEINPQNPNGPPRPKVVFELTEVLRMKVSDYPVSAMSLSGDFSTLVLGDTNGSITLLSTHNDKFNKIKFWESAHDLPVTAIAARPLPLPLNGEELTGVAIDAISASADNKLCFVTKQRRSTLKKKKTRTGRKAHTSGGILSYLIHLVLFIMIIYAIKVSYDVCHEDFVGFDNMEGVKQCVIHTVFWASSDRPGIAVIPH